MTELAGMGYEGLAEWVRALGLPAYRAAQLYRGSRRGIAIPDMTDLPKELRARLAELAVSLPLTVERTEDSASGAARKMLYRFADGQLAEGVLMAHAYGHTLCVSTQAGCRMGCAFCASSKGGLARNLTAGEIFGQVVAANRALAPGARVRNVVLMGSGEPLDNYDATVAALRALSDTRDVLVPLRNTSLSTCGLVPEMLRLAESRLPVTLCVSLHAPNDEIRRRFMPIAHRYGIDETVDACRAFVAATGRRVIFEYAMIDGVNDALECADELAGRIRRLQCHVNLIPLNPIAECGLRGSNEKAVAAFLGRLEARHISASRRAGLGADIGGACGQLRRLYAGRPEAIDGVMR